MRLSPVAVTFLVLFINALGLTATSEDANSDASEDNNEDENNLLNTEEYFSVETTFPDDSYDNGTESLEETTVGYPLSKAGESETKIPQIILDPDECGDPASVKNALLVEGKQIRYEVDAKVTYACEFGYITDGSVHSSVCLLSDDTQTLYWTKPEIRCTPRSCGDPGYVAHAHRVGSVFTFPNKISFECDDGYAMRGYGTRYCQTSGSWSGNLPTCEPVFCDPPANPKNGKVSYSSLGFESELHYECDAGFILRNDPGRICSANGTWSGSEPTCQEAQCDPPVSPEHGSVQIIGDKSSVGSMALYTCDEGRVLVGSASSRCLDIGEWTFPTPRCLEPCFVPKIEHGKIGRYVGYYRRKKFDELYENSKIKDGEELYLRCEPNFEPFGNPETEVKTTCAHGEWEAFPVCVPGMCRGPPPPTTNGVVARANRTHGGIVVYHCRQHAIKTKYGTVTCNFGTWKGITPVCKDLRCSVDDLSFPGLSKNGNKKFYLPNHPFTVSCERGYNLTKENNQLRCVNGSWQGHLPPCIAASCNAEDLVQSEGIVADDEKIVLNGESLKVRCQEGYSPTGKQARCYRGQWTVAEKLCQESSCTAHKINNGGFSERVEKKQLNWKLSFDRWSEFPRLRLGQSFSPGQWIYVSCDDRYVFQGTQIKQVLVQCLKGKWNPDPVCQIMGTPNRKEAKTPLEKDKVSNTRTNSQVDRSALTTRQPLPFTTEFKTREPEVVMDPKESLQPTPYPSCTCTYRNLDDSVLAFVGTEQLSYGSKVNNNDKIKFHCKFFGYSRLRGMSEIKCENCRSWHSSEFPECVLPKIGDTILQFEGNYTILGDGIIGIAAGKQLTLRCASNGIEDYPYWSTTIREPLISINYNDGSGHYVSMLNISNASSQHSGVYRCHLQGTQPYAFHIQVISPSSVNCSKFNDRDYTIHYDKEQAVNSTVIFSCKDRQKKLDGPNIVTCLSNGQWSGNPPKCKMTCPLIEETDGMTISYTNGLVEGSIAGFHCLVPRNRSGVARTICMANGQWANPPPRCTLSSCSMDQLFDVIPENVVPDMEGVTSDALPYNSSLRLTCDKGMMLSGSDVVKCGQDGRWQVSKVQCISGCGHPRTGNSELILEPDKNFYRFGESVSLSCSPGYVLNSEVVRLMCLGTSWSEDVLPECIKE